VATILGAALVAIGVAILHPHPDLRVVLAAILIGVGIVLAHFTDWPRRPGGPGPA
jgi:hypothetical protein